MIRSVRFENFRCLREVELSLEPLTLLVGPPASGKTTVLDGLDLQLGCDVVDFWRQDERRKPVVEWWYDTGKHTRVEYPLDELDSSPMQTHSLQVLTLDLAAMREGSSTGRASALNRTGDNLAGVFASLLPGQRQRVVQELCRLMPMLGDVGLQQTGPRVQRLRFRDRWQADLWYTPDKVGDAHLLALAGGWGRAGEPAGGGGGLAAAAQGGLSVAEAWDSQGRARAGAQGAWRRSGCV
jgi:hypothetical protein